MIKTYSLKSNKSSFHLLDKYFLSCFSVFAPEIVRIKTYLCKITSIPLSNFKGKFLKQKFYKETKYFNKNKNKMLKDKT